MTSVIRSVRKEAAVPKIEGVLADHKAMTTFVPEIAPTDVKGMSAEEATALLTQLRAKSLLVFQENLGVTMEGFRKSIIQESPLLADDDMKGVREDMVLESKQNLYFQDLKKAIEGVRVPMPWICIPRVKPEDLESEEDQKEANHGGSEAWRMCGNEIRS